MAAWTHCTRRRRRRWRKWRWRWMASVISAALGMEGIGREGVEGRTEEGTWRTSFRDLLQGDGVPSPVVGQIGVGRCVLLLHVDSWDEARLKAKLGFSTHHSLCVFQSLPCLPEEDERGCVSVWERECVCLSLFVCVCVSLPPPFSFSLSTAAADC